MANSVQSEAHAPESLSSQSIGATGEQFFQLLLRVGRGVRRRLVKRFPPANSSSSSIPQAVIEDPSVKIEDRDWRSYFAHQLHGRGLEIGPLHRPMVTHPGMQLDYVDRYTVAQLRACYIELKDLPLVEPNIIDDAETFNTIKDASYDFLISAHVIEHMKNPIRALENWCRVIRPGGKIYLIVPDKRVTFDKLRVRTTLEHLILDYKRPSVERDFEHCLDYALHVHNQHGLEALKGADTIVETDYSIHFHTFIPQDIYNLVTWFSQNVRRLTISEGPVMTPTSDEFHLMLTL